MLTEKTNLSLNKDKQGWVCITRNLPRISQRLTQVARWKPCVIRDREQKESLAARESRMRQSPDAILSGKLFNSAPLLRLNKY